MAKLFAGLYDTVMGPLEKRWIARIRKKIVSDLEGKVLEIGGVKEKVLAAHRAGLTTIILPKDNAKDLEDTPKNVKRDLQFIFAEHLDEVLKVALTRALPTEKDSQKKVYKKAKETPVLPLAQTVA